MFAPDVLCFSVIQRFFSVVFNMLHNTFSVLLRILLSAWAGGGGEEAGSGHHEVVGNNYGST